MNTNLDMYMALEAPPRRLDVVANVKVATEKIVENV